MRTVLALTLLVSPAMAGIINGTFETGDTTGWTLANQVSVDRVCLSGETIGATTCVVNGGSYAMSFGNGSTPTSFSQEVVTTPGNLYDLTFYLANDNEFVGGPNSFEVKWGGTTVFSLLTNQPTFSFTLQSFSGLSASTGATTLEFLAVHGPSQWFLDDVVVTDAGAGPAVPEPSSLWLAGGAFAALAWRRSRGDA